MAEVLKDKVELYAGSITGLALEQASLDALYDVIKHMITIKPDSFYEFSKTVTFEDKYAVSAILGVDAIRHVFQKGRPATYIPPELRVDAESATSIYLATAHSPSWTYYNGYLTCYPPTAAVAGEAEVVVPDTGIDLAADDSIDNFPAYLYNAWAMRLAMTVLVQKIGAALDAMNNLTLDALSINSAFPKDEGAVPGDIGIQIKPSFQPTFTAWPTSDLASAFTEASAYISDSWDESLAQAKQAEIATRIQDYMQELDGQLKEWNASMAEYQASNSRYSLALQRYQADVGIEVQEYQSLVGQFSTKLQGYMSELQGLASQYQIVKDLYQSELPQPEPKLQYERRRYKR